MKRKLTLEEFNEIKNKLWQIYNESNKIDYSTASNYEEYENQYKIVQSQLLSYDLSDIPFEEWRDIALFSDDEYTLDFSKTNANIDFEIISELSNFNGNENFKGCNIKNLDFFDMAPKPGNFDQEVIEANPSLFLSNIIPEEIKELFYTDKLKLTDLVGLSVEQVDELEQKNAIVRIPHKERKMVSELGFVKALELLSSISATDFELLIATFDYFWYIYHNNMIKKIESEFIQKVINIDSGEVRAICHECLKNILIHSPHKAIQISTLPKLFVEENAEFLLSDVSIPQELREKYYERNLTFEDIINNYLLFENIPIDNFLDINSDIYLLAEYLGFGNLQKVLKEHLDFVTHIINSDHMAKFINQMNRYLPFEERLNEAVKKYLLKYGLDDYVYDLESKEMNYVLPKWISSFDFKFLDKLTTVDDLLNLDSKTILLHEGHRKFVERFGISNIKKLEQKIGYFSHKPSEFSRELETLYPILDYFDRRERVDAEFNFKNGMLPYEEFEFEFIKLLNSMRKDGAFVFKFGYEWITGEFREKYKQYFISSDAPADVEEIFYKPNYGLGINADFFYRCPNMIQYFKDTNLWECIDFNIRIKTDSGEYIDFVEYYAKCFGNEAFLELMVNYGDFCHNLEIPAENGLVGTKEEIDAYFRKIVASRVIEAFIPFECLKNIPEYFAEYPEMFVDFSHLSTIPEPEQRRLEEVFYHKNLSFEDIRKYPELAEYLKEKNLFIAFGQRGREKWIRLLQEKRTGNYNKTTDNFSDLELIHMYGSENFLRLCLDYGDYLGGISIALHKKFPLKDGKYMISENQAMSFEELTKEIETIIAEKCLLGELPYTPKDAPKFLKETHPELFLAENAPKDLQDSFYDIGISLSFLILENNKEWLPYLEGKSVQTALLRNNWTSRKYIMKYFEVFGDKAVKLGTTKARTVMHMIENNKIDVMKKWYDLTGGKFIPDFVVMENFPLELADKFFTSTASWSSLLKIRNFSKHSDSREAILKLAYAFGVFDNDQIGLKKLQTLLTDIPRTIDASYHDTMERISELGGIYTEPNKYWDCDNIEEYKLLRETLEDEGIIFDPKEEIFSQIYKSNEDGSYTLMINPQRCPKSTNLIRTILHSYSNSLTLSPNRACHLFGKLELKYDKDFRDFLLANMEEILNNPEYNNLISIIHTQFSDIKAINSNRTLTLDLVISYIQSNRFSNVNTGNECVAEISAIAGYDQHEFNTLQKIYNYGKQRTFSSIPAVENTYQKYSYEILRLDDPYAMIIGVLTDCCQRLGREGEVCMEHSMIDANGRIFVVRDDEGNVIAQSWVWRNKDVLCFDNIEIPDKAISRATKMDSELGKEKLAGEIYAIYKEAAEEILAKDEEVYRVLYEEGRLTEDEYDRLRLRKITVGLGYNDAAVAIKKNSQPDTEIISRPPRFVEKVNLSRNLYIADSEKQYVLAKNTDRNVDRTGRIILNLSNDQDFKVYTTLPLYNDEYIIYDDSNLNEKLLLTLQKLEIVTKGYTYNLNTSLSDNAKPGSYVTELANNYGFDPQSCRVVMNPNFAIVFDTDGEVIKIGDLFYNTRIDNKDQQMDIESTVILQIRLALNQITKDKAVDISNLNVEQKEMYKKAMKLTNELDMERGLSIK